MKQDFMNPTLFPKARMSWPLRNFSITIIDNLLLRPDLVKKFGQNAFHLKEMLGVLNRGDNFSLEDREILAALCCRIRLRSNEDKFFVKVLSKA
jgi:hypothetical protein